MRCTLPRASTGALDQTVRQEIRFYLAEYGYLEEEAR